MSETSSSVTELLTRVSAGSDDARSELFRAVENELRAIAARYLSQERVDHSLQPTMLVDEAFVRLIGSDVQVSWADRRHFYATAARVMRRILVDHEKRRRAQKHGGGHPAQPVPDLDRLVSVPPLDDLLVFDELLDRLAETAPKLAEVVQLHIFGGYTHEEVGNLLGIGKRAVLKRWKAAKAWLHRELTRGSRED